MAINFLTRMFLCIILFLSPEASFAYEMRSVNGNDNISSDKSLIVEIPEIRKKLKTPITVDFMDVGLDYVVDFLSDITGVNIIPGNGVKLPEKKVTIKVKDMPLESLLKYIFRNYGLTYRIEKNAVWVDTLEDMENEAVETRMYFLDQGLAMFTEFSGATSGVKGGVGGGAAISKVKTIKDVLENAVAWPSDSKINLDERTGALIITNTPSNLKVIEDILYNLDVDSVQVLVEARFVETDVTDLSELGVNLTLNSPLVFAKKAINGSAVTQIGSQSGSSFSTFTGAPDEGLNITYQGILTKPQFSAVLHALEKNTNLKTLSAPKITTLNNQIATIEIADEFVYPTSYSPSVVFPVVNGVQQTTGAQFVNVAQGFETRPIGILLHVTPSVGKDRETITLTLNPEVSEATPDAFQFSGNVKLPKFSTRSLNTNIVVQNGDTIVLGGLMKENKTKTRTKTPFLGDLPIVGAAFRKDSDSTERKNLLIFVTASIIGSEGEKLQ